MAYHNLSECTLSDAERRAEADKLVEILKDSLDQMEVHEKEFVGRIRQKNAFVTVRQLFWLRDLRDKY